MRSAKRTATVQTRCLVVSLIFNDFSFFEMRLNLIFTPSTARQPFVFFTPHFMAILIGRKSMQRSTVNEARQKSKNVLRLWHNIIADVFEPRRLECITRTDPFRWIELEHVVEQVQGRLRKATRVRRTHDNVRSMKSEEHDYY